MVSIKRDHLYQVLPLLLSLLLISQCTCHFKTIDTKKIIGKCRKGVVRLVFLRTIQDESTGESHDIAIPAGSGFVISKDGYLLTAQHIIGEMSGFEGPGVITDDGRTLQASLLQPYPSDSGPDIGMLKIDNPVNLSHLSIAEVDSLELGEGVVVLGYPEKDLTVTQGIINTLSRKRETFRISATVSGGASGSPVLNSDGKVIGIVTYNVRKLRPDSTAEAFFGTAANVVMHRKEILDFIEQHRKQHKK